MRTRQIRIIAALGLALAILLPATSAFAQTDGNAPREPIQTEIRVPVPAPDLVPASEDRFRSAYLIEGKVEDIAQYIGIIYNFLISIVGLVAAVVVIVGGFQYLTSAGDSARIGAAKSRMANAFIGLVLALGAYTILNNINPALLTLKLPDFRAVKTVIFTLPVCEDLIAQGTSVHPYGSGTSCGYAGKYAQGNTEQVCIFSGDCRLKNTITGDPSYGHSTCMQRGGIESEQVKAELAKNPNATFALCLSCADLTEARARSIGFTDLQVACEAWQNAFALVPSSFKTYTRKSGGTEYTVKDGLFYGCYPRTHKEGCVGIPLFCWDITRDDDTVGDNEGWKGNGCQGYDEGPNVLWGTDLDSNGFNTKIHKHYGACGGITGIDGAGLECFPVHLGNVCGWNPCVNYRDPETGNTPFINGCRSANGAIFKIQRVVRHGDFGSVDDCRCATVDGKNCT